jgi:hypothetical protein
VPPLKPRAKGLVFECLESSPKHTRYAKTKLLGKDKDGISAVDPDKYASRFLSFMGGRIEE